MARTVPALARHKRRDGADPLVMVTAYDAPGAAMASEAGVDLILVGDTLAMVVLGHEDTLSVTVDEMAHHVAAVARARPEPLVIGDLPWMSYHTTTEAAVHNAATLVRAGASAVKLEGGRKRLGVIGAILDAEIPVMGHIGLTPQSSNVMGGFRVQGRELDAIDALIADAEALADAGVFSIVLEGIPDRVADLVTEAVDVPTIGIGAGAGCDGQVLVWHDVLGIEQRLAPKFVRRYADVRSVAVGALQEYAADVRAGRFPADAETYHLAPEVASELDRRRGT
ncbi:MAG: 3-methyl-2-oxobutanoate hydroxymethyltransferase [Actinomycetota bacterium]|nr:3-methyl-2-oxobutanoate hydroxymethyltransferase [Actinomycetota bacterium]